MKLNYDFILSFFYSVSWKKWAHSSTSYHLLSARSWQNVKNWIGPCSLVMARQCSCGRLASAVMALNHSSSGSLSCNGCWALRWAVCCSGVSRNSCQVLRGIRRRSRAIGGTAVWSAMGCLRCFVEISLLTWTLRSGTQILSVSSLKRWLEGGFRKVKNEVYARKSPELESDKRKWYHSWTVSDPQLLRLTWFWYWVGLRVLVVLFLLWSCLCYIAWIWC